jgi:hypothetical protein
MPRLLTCLAVTVALAVPASAQEPSPSPAAPARAGEEKQVVPGPHYRAGGLHRLIFGDHYRALWTAPLTAEVLDLQTFSGGLTARRKGGGRQTKTLRLDGADGREWKFRSLDKDPSAVLPPELRDTFVDAIVQDQISAANPAGPLVTDALAEAAGVLYVPHRLVILPDDPALGEFRKEFGGLLGMLEEDVNVKPPVTPGFEAYSRVEDTVELWERLDKHPEEKVDARAYLKARLLDVLLGDFDRHKDQWQWVKPRDAQTWLPVPEDRDQAFAKYDGFALWLVRPSQPDLVDFREEYPRIFGLTWSGRFVDRRHLSELTRADWQPVVADLQARLSDAAIDEAVRRLPPEHYRLGGAALARRLKARRDHLPEAAREFYRQLTREVEIHGSDETDVVHVTPDEDGTVLVRVSGADGQTRFQRNFRPQETDEVRLHLKGGNDHVARAAGTGAIRLRVVGGAGDDVVDDTGGGDTAVYDEAGTNRVLRGPGTTLDERPYTHPPDVRGNPARDWGRTVMGTPLIGGGGDLGLFLGGRVSLVGYGFRKHPFAFRHTVRGGWAMGVSAIQAQYEGDVYRTNSNTHARLLVRGSQIDILRFHGFGNETAAPQDKDFFRVEQRHFLVSPSVFFGPPGRNVELGLVASHASTPTPGNTFIGTTRPYGVGDFGQGGVRGRATLGQRNLDRPTSGLVWAGGTYYPKFWDVEDDFGSLEAQAVGFLAPRTMLGPQLGLRIGAKKVFGRFPFHEAAFIGGPDQVRGLRAQRYAGDAAVFGSAELHLRLAEVRVLLPSHIGVVGIADVGRVYLEGESSDEWHSGLGGGIWLAPLKRSTSIALLLARSEGENKLYIQGGFGF